MSRQENNMPSGGRKMNRGNRPEQETVKKADVRPEDDNKTINKETALEKKIIEEECKSEIQQLEVLKRLKRHRSRNAAVDTLLHCENNPADAELIALSIIKKRTKRGSPLNNENISGSHSLR
jgi:hypothetical protein